MAVGYSGGRTTTERVNMKRVTQDLICELRGKAEKSDKEAQYNLGVRYLNGQGVAKDSSEAVRWWRMAAEEGYAPAQFNLACAYRLGEGVRMDTAETVKWYRKAFDQGLGNAGINLALMYANGEGVTQDYVEAYRLLSLAAKRSRSAAVSRRRELETRMTAEQVAEAKRLLRAVTTHENPPSVRRRS